MRPTYHVYQVMKSSCQYMVPPQSNFPYSITRNMVVKRSTEGYTATNIAILVCFRPTQNTFANAAMSLGETAPSLTQSLSLAKMVSSLHIPQRINRTGVYTRLPVAAGLRPRSPSHSFFLLAGCAAPARLPLFDLLRLSRQRPFISAQFERNGAFPLNHALHRSRCCFFHVGIRNSGKHRPMLT
jgi:hypothetical protein